MSARAEVAAGSAGRSAGREARRRRWAAGVRLAVAGVAGGAGWFLVPDPWRWVIVVAGVVAGLWPSHAGRWAAGAAGERATAYALDGIEREGWTVLHDVGLRDRRWNVDHLLVGPPGIVIVETKRWASPVRVGRRHRPAVLRRVAWQVDAVERALPTVDVPIHQFLCVHGARVRRRWWARRAPVGDGTHLRRWLRRLPRRLDESEVARLVAIARSTFVSR